MACKPAVDPVIGTAQNSIVYLIGLEVNRGWERVLVTHPGSFVLPLCVPNVP